MDRCAIVLLSGGLDSTTCLAIATRRERLQAHCVSFDYGQRHRYELDAAREAAVAFGAASHRVVRLDPQAFAGSALTDAAVAVPKDRSDAEIGDGVPATYVPARNTVFLAYALALSEVLHAEAIYVGVNALDSSGYPDCRPAFIEAFQRLAHVATAAGVGGRGVRIEAPLLALGKAEIVALGAGLGVDYSRTHSCYDPGPDGGACARCDACRLRAAGFAKANLPDPTRYAR